MANIFLSVPILDKPEFKMVYNLYQSILSCKEHRVRLFVNENDSLISRVRNVHMSLFLNEFKECDYFISIDSDLEVVNCYHTNNIFTKLLSHNKDFVGALYALKQPNGVPMSSSIPLDNTINRESIPFDKGLIEMRWLSAGCWCIKRSVVEKMVESYPELTYVGDDNVTGKMIHGLYIPQVFEIEDSTTGKKFRKYLSEDWCFCERWRKIGGQIFADTSVVLRHIGKYPYSLWNVEVVAKKTDSPATPTVTKLDPSKLKIEELKNQVSKSDGLLNNIKNGVKQNFPDIPPAGWDLNNKG